jgi:thiamine biosynthesis lipoprotein
LLKSERKVHLETRSNHVIAACFFAMASPCEVLIQTTNKKLAQSLGAKAAEEVWRIEKKYSRYQADSVLSQINQSNGQAILVDEETAGLLDFAFICYELSDGLFDITSGVLRKVWRFDGSANIPEPKDIEDILPFVGLDKISWKKPYITLPANMELDFGGIGKEYAADRALALLTQQSDLPILVNLGGDLCCQKSPTNAPWQVGIENPNALAKATMILELSAGALATSGDTHRFLEKDGQRYGHILNPKTGWPVQGGPSTVTVAATQCLQAGMLATMALLQGAEAEAFLQAQEQRYWLQA